MPEAERDGHIEQRPTLSIDIEDLVSNGFEVISFKRGRDRYFYVPEQDMSIPELKIIIDALQAVSFVTEKKTAELVEKVAAIGGSHRAELLTSNMVRFNQRKHTNEAKVCLRTF